jgi:hypothetical protein
MSRPIPGFLNRLEAEWNEAVALTALDISILKRGKQELAQSQGAGCRRSVVGYQKQRPEMGVCENGFTHATRCS